MGWRSERLQSFPCKTLWLKKGYDFIDGKNNFNAADSVVKLGVGKNMVASIRYWLKTFGLVKEGGLTEVARFVFADNSGMDPYIEDLGTLWLLHYLLVSSHEATLYNLLFTRFQRERRVFERQHIISFVKRYMAENGKLKTYNENTVKKDVAVLLQNYVQPMKAQAMEDTDAIGRLENLDSIIADTEKRIDALSSVQTGLKKTELDLNTLSRDVDKKFKVLNDITKQDLAKNPNKKSNALNPQTSDSVRQLKRQGWTIADIAKRLDLTENEVDLILQLPE